MKAEFHNPLDVRFLPETDDPVWMLLTPLVYSSAVMGCQITVPAGFITNYVSFGPLKNVGHRAAVVHDFLYSCEDIDRETADKVFLEALEYCGVPERLAHSMFAAVRVFGGAHKGNNYRFYP